jgi:hypothetical protein
MFTQEFYQQLTLTIIGVGLGGLALWTWQRKYWEYQLYRQREDWMLRQCYSRKESQRVAMEQVLVEINSTLEEFVNTTLLAASAIQRREDYINQGSTTEEGIKSWDQEVSKSTEQFNESERKWLTQSRIISGKIGLYFEDKSDKFKILWSEIIQQSEGTCSLFYPYPPNIQNIYDKMAELRDRKNELLGVLQKEIDYFVFEKLEPPRIN